MNDVRSGWSMGSTEDVDSGVGERLVLVLL